MPKKKKTVDNLEEFWGQFGVESITRTKDFTLFPFNLQMKSTNHPLLKYSLIRPYNLVKEGPTTSAP